MPSVSLTLRQTTVPTTTIDGGANYAVTNIVTASIGISPAVFVFKTDTSKFDHHATPVDMDTLPTTQIDAVSAGLGFYRQSSVMRVWTTIAAMNDDLALTKSRLASLARETSQIQNSLVVDQTTTIQAG